MKFQLAALVFSIIPAVITAAAIPRPQDATSCDGGSYEACVGNTVCATVWPDSCNCLNSVNNLCAAACGALAPESQDCTVDTEPVDTEPVDTEPVDTEPVYTEPVDTEPVDTEPVDTEPVDTEPVDTEPVDTEP
ncbi:hypothetical protein RUND412_010768, partial [Rhizina undulata]